MKSHWETANLTANLETHERSEPWPSAGSIHVVPHFYMGINLGAAIGPLVASTFGEKLNWHYGFGAAGVGMVLGLSVTG